MFIPAIPIPYSPYYVPYYKRNEYGIEAFHDFYSLCGIRNLGDRSVVVMHIFLDENDDSQIHHVGAIVENWKVLCQN